MAARAVNKQTQAGENIGIEHQSLKEVHCALYLQYQEMAASTEILRHTILQLRNQYQVRIRSGSQSRGHDHKQTEAHIKEHERRNTGISSDEPKPKYAKHKPQVASKTNTTSVSSVKFKNAQDVPNACIS